MGAASDRFYRNRPLAVATGFWMNTFPFDRSGELRGLADAAELLREGHNVLLYPQGTRSAGTTEGFRTGVARLCLATGGAAAARLRRGHLAHHAQGPRAHPARAHDGGLRAPAPPRPGEDPRSFMERSAGAIEALGERARRGR